MPVPDPQTCGSVVVVHYGNQLGGPVNEVLVFAGGLVREGHGTYLV